MWVFGYGSLMWGDWKAEFQGINRGKARLRGYHRAFNKKSTSNWGRWNTPCPTLGLEKSSNEECVGLVFKFNEDQRQSIKAYLEEREGKSFKLVEKEVELASGQKVMALTPINRHNMNTYICNIDINARVDKEIPNKRLSDATNKHNHSFTLKIESLMYGKNLIDFLHSNHQLFKKNIKTVYYAHFSLDSHLLLDTIKDIKALSNNFSLQITNELVRFDIQDLYYDEITQEDLHTLNCKEPQLEEYPINFLGRIFLKFYKYTEVLKFFLRAGKNLKLKFQFSHHSYLKCYLAPIKEEQEDFEYEEYNTTYFYPESSNKITKVPKDPKSKNTNISRLKRKVKIPIPNDPEQFLKTFKDNLKTKKKSAQTNFTDSGNTINSKVRNQFIKKKIKERKGKIKTKKLSDKEFRKRQLNSIKKLGD